MVVMLTLEEKLLLWRAVKKRLEGLWGANCESARCVCVSVVQMPRNALLMIENDGSQVHNWEDLRFRFEKSRK